MPKKDLKKRNVRYLFLGEFFFFLTSICGSFFLPYFLKEEGFNIAQIGLFMTLGIALGTLIVAIFFSKIQKRIRLKYGLATGSVFEIISSGALVIFPNSIGTVIREGFHRIGTNVYNVAGDISFQHNTEEKNKRTINSTKLTVEGFAYIIGLGLSVFLILNFGYRLSFFIFALLGIPALIFVLKVNDDTRFKQENKQKKEKISGVLKLFLAADIIYNFALSASFVLVMTFLISDKYSGSISWIAFLFGTLYVSMTLSSILTKRLLNKMNLVLSTILGMAVLILSAVLIIISTDLYVVLAAMVLEGIGAGIWVPSQYAYYWKLTKPSQREAVSGYYNGIKSSTKAIAPLFGGWIAATLGILAPFYMKIILAAISIVIYIYVFMKIRHIK